MTTIQQHNDHRPPSPSPSQLPPVPASPTYSHASTAHHHNHPPGLGGPSSSSSANMNMNMNMSAYSLPLPPPPPAVPHAVLTKTDLAASQQAYAELLTTAKSYRVALASLSTAASAFGAALEACARLKEARADSLALGAAAGLVGAPNNHTATASGGCTADALLAAAGVHHLVANHEQILSETVYRAFEVPLLHELDKWRRDVEDEQARYLAAVRRQSQAIRRLEKEGLKLHRQKGPRDVAKFRGHLVELTTQLDGLTSLHGEHARTLLREGQDTSVKIVEASCSLVRAEVDIFEALARKGWSGGGLDDILERGQDLFAPSDEDEAGSFAAPNIVGGVGGGGDDAKLFSILPPKSILADTTTTMAGDLLAGPGATEHYNNNNFTRGRSSNPQHYNNNHNNHNNSYHHGHQRADSLGVASEPYQSLTGAVTNYNTSAATTGGSDMMDAASIFSADFTTTTSSGRPRMTRPFSPQPIRVRPEDVMGGGGGSDDDEEDEEDRATERKPLAGGHHHHHNNSSDDEEDDEKRASSPETIREEEGGRGGDASSHIGGSRFMSRTRTRKRLPRRDLSLGGTSTSNNSTSSREDEEEEEERRRQGGEVEGRKDDEDDEDDDEDEEDHPWGGNAKRTSSAASDPEERERRWE